MITILIMAAVGAFIGYLTNVLAIKLLFRPIKPTKVFKIQGVIPKRQAEIATSIGEIVEEELLSVNDIMDKLIEKTDKEKVLNSIKIKILDLIRNKSMMFAMFEQVIKSNIDDIFEKEGDNLIEQMTQSIIIKATESISIKTMVEQKIMSLDLEYMEKIIVKIAKHELKHIEYLGGLLGMIIGMVQGILVFYMNIS